MSEVGYIECMVACKPSMVMRFLRILGIMLAVVFFLLTTFNFFFIFLCIAAGVGAYFAGMNASIEYEYQYCDHEISVDKIYNKSRRKNMAKFETERMEILAPIRSYHLDEFNGKTYKELHYESGYEQQPDPRYVMIYDGREKVFFEPSAEMVEAIRGVVPRKVYRE
ncbi:MAG: hypothetical protein IJT34_01745 [Butyrivibrio sp.]|nr:hypothetical protein [Butyrivibrio sp.]